MAAWAAAGPPPQGRGGAPGPAGRGTGGAGVCRWECFLSPGVGGGGAAPPAGHGGAGAAQWLRARLRSLAAGHVWECSPPKVCEGPGGAEGADLWGDLDLGDGLDDEWLLVGLLLRVSAEGGVAAGTAFRVWDPDGEFLLIEAAESLPRWLTPKTARGRVFLCGGEFHVVPRECGGGTSSSAPSPSLPEALEWVRSPRDTLMPAAARTELRARVEAARGRRDHVAHCVLPRKAARLLRWEPQVVAAAAHCLLARGDGPPEQMAAAASAECFPPSADAGPAAVRFNRCLYARLMQEPIVPPRGHPPLQPGCAAFKEQELGLKVLMGLEMAVWQLRGGAGGGRGDSGGGSDTLGAEYLRRAVEWRALGEGGSGGWGDSATRASGALRDALTSDEALLAFLGDDGGSAGSLPPADDDSWLDDGEALLQQAMNGFGPAGGGGREAEEMLRGLKSFIDTKTSHFGAEAPGSGSGAAGVDIEGILSELKGTLGLGGHSDFADIGSASESGVSDSDSAQTDAGSSSSGEESRPSAHRYLHRGVLDPASDSDDEEIDGDAGAAFAQEYTAALREQLREAAPAAPPGEAEDVDLEVVRGLLDSVAAQEGLPGPGSNLLGLLGVRLPADPPAAPDRTGP